MLSVLTRILAINCEIWLQCLSCILFALYFEFLFFLTLSFCVGLEQGQHGYIAIHGNTLYYHTWIMWPTELGYALPMSVVCTILIMPC